MVEELLVHAEGHPHRGTRNNPLRSHGRLRFACALFRVVASVVSLVCPSQCPCLGHLLGVSASQLSRALGAWAKVRGGAAVEAGLDAPIDMAFFRFRR